MSYELKRVPIWVRERNKSKDILDFLKQKLQKANPVSFAPDIIADKIAKIIKTINSLPR